MLEPIQSSSATAVLRRQNRDLLLGLLAQRGALSRTQLAAQTELTTAAISRITRELIAAGILQEGETVKADRVGRREVQLSINAQGAYVLAISLTANRKHVALANALGETVLMDSFDDLALHDPEQALISITNRAKALVYDADFNRSRLLGVGVAAAVTEGVATERVTSRPLGWDKIPMRALLSQQLGLPVKIEPRASALLRAEIASQPDPGDLYLVNIALGMGVSAYLGGRIVNPGDAGFGSLTHLLVPGQDEPCYCGRRGCLESCASGLAIAQQLGFVDSAAANPSQHMIEAIARAEAGDSALQQIFYQAGTKLAFGLDAVLTLFNPRRIILAGEVGRQRDFVAGAIAALQSAGRDAAAARVSCSTLTSAQAAISVALQEFVFTEALDIEKLKAA